MIPQDTNYSYLEKVKLKDKMKVRKMTTMAMENARGLQHRHHRHHRDHPQRQRLDVG